MKKRLWAVLLAAALACSLVGCGGESGDGLPEASAVASEDSGLTDDTYQVARDLFVEQYRADMTEIQTLVASAVLDDSWWGSFEAKQREAAELSDKFFQLESTLPKDCKDDFSSVKKAVQAYADAMGVIAGAKGQSADNQANILADGTQKLNQASLNWKTAVSGSSSSAGKSSQE